MRVLLVTGALLLACAPAAMAGGMNGLLVSNYSLGCIPYEGEVPSPMISAIAGWVADGEMAEGGKPFTAELSVGVVGRP